MNGMKMIQKERQRQIAKEGWTTKHDDTHDNQQLKRAAEAYMLSAARTQEGFKSFRPPDCWPWEKRWWKPSTPVRDLTKAGALYLAEMERMQRLGANKALIMLLKCSAEGCALRIDALNA